MILSDFEWFQILILRRLIPMQKMYTYFRQTFGAKTSLAACDCILKSSINSEIVFLIRNKSSQKRCVEGQWRWKPFHFRQSRITALIAMCFEQLFTHVWYSMDASKLSSVSSSSIFWRDNSRSSKIPLLYLYAETIMISTFRQRNCYLCAEQPCIYISLLSSTWP